MRLMLSLLLVNILSDKDGNRGKWHNNGNGTCETNKMQTPQIVGNRRTARAEGRSAWANFRSEGRKF